MSRVLYDQDSKVAFSSEGDGRKKDVVIVGGGIGGLASAYALTRKGLAVRVLEAAPAFGEVGAGLQIAPNCTRILDDWGLLNEVISLGVLPENIIMRDAEDGHELTRLDLADVKKRYGHPYLVIHRSDLHGVLLRACQRVGVDLVTNATVVKYENLPNGQGARAYFKCGRVEEAEVVIAADGMHSVARPMISGDKPLSSDYVAYRGAVSTETVKSLDVSMKDVVVYVGEKRHLVQYPLRQGEMFNLVAVFESPKAKAGKDNWGTPDELDGAFAGSCKQVTSALPHMWRDRWWRMFTRAPIMNWLIGDRIALTGDAAHPPLQYLAQGAVMAIEDAWVLSEHVGMQELKGSANKGTKTGLDWGKALKAYNAVRPEHCRRVLETAWDWGDLWHLGGRERLLRNAAFEARDVHNYDFVDWLVSRNERQRVSRQANVNACSLTLFSLLLVPSSSHQYGPTALKPEQEPKMFQPQDLENYSAKL